MKRLVLWVLLLLNGLLLCLPLMVLVSFVNPMGAMFIVPVTIENRTPEAIRVTPVGVRESGRRGLLPVFLWHFPTVWGFRNRDFAIGPGESLRIRYDWDDIRLSEIVVHDGRGGAQTVAVDAPSGEPVRVVIADLAALPAASPDVLAVASRGFHNWWPWFVAVVSVLAIPVSFVAVLRGYRRARNATARGARRFRETVR